MGLTLTKHWASSTQCNHYLTILWFESRWVIALREKIEALQGELDAIIAESAVSTDKKPPLRPNANITCPPPTNANS